jgi:HEPN domain-containing protein
MTTANEVRRWLKDAEAGLRGAKKALTIDEPRMAIQNAQFCIEQSTKAVIACFAEPKWEHDPKDQLDELLEEYEDELIQRIGEGLLDKIRRLGEDSAKVAEWHAWSTYGREEGDKGWTPAVELCTQDIADEMVEKAEMGFEAASKFLKAWFGKKWQEE